MKRALLFFGSALTLGALTGFLVSDFPKLAPQLPPVASSVSTFAPHSSTVSADRKTAFGRAINAGVAIVASSQGRKPVTSVGLLLNEPVVIMHGGEQAGTSLPQGTSVALVKNEGRFLRVRHDQNVVTIPRSAVVLGVARTN